MPHRFDKNGRRRHKKTACLYIKKFQASGKVESTWYARVLEGSKKHKY